jgi:hypothetical protein
LTLTNDSTDGYRRFARWSVVHRLEVVGGSPLRALATAEIVDVDSANLTWADVQRSA